MNTTRRQFLSASGAGLLAACSASEGPSSAAKPNVLWIIAEDFSPQLACYGDPLVSTPNIDKLASESVLYTQACVTAPICSISRSALVTGMYQTSIGAHNHRSHRDDNYRLPEGVRIFPDLFREAGYHTSNLNDTPVGGTGKTDFNFNLDGPPYDGDDWTQRAEGQPFYAQINFQETHRAFRPDPEKPIDAARIALPAYYPDHALMRRDWALYLETAQHLDDRVGAVLDRLESEGLAEDTIVFFFADHGRPMPRGKQFLYEGGMRIPLIVRIPEKFRPEGWTSGSKNEQLLSHIDITATSLALCGIARPEKMQGRVFIGPNADPQREVQFAARDRADETVDRIRAARTRQYKYIRNFMPERPYTQPNNYKDTSYPPLMLMRQLHAEGKLKPEQALFMASKRPDEELFDLHADPDEVRNLVASPEHQRVLGEMRAHLEQWIEESGDTGATPEAQLPGEYDVRTKAGGWFTTSGSLNEGPAAIEMKWAGKASSAKLPWVAEPGEYVVKLRARSKDAPLAKLTWSTVDNMRAAGNETAIEMKADGKWQNVEAPIRCADWFCGLGLNFGEAEGVFELASISLMRDGKPVKEWSYAKT